MDAWDDTVAKQIIGRTTRFCGSKNLDFDDIIDKNGVPRGWKLTVDRYYEVVDKVDRRKLGKARTPTELLLNHGSIDLAFLARLGNQIKLRNLAVMASVDRILNDKRIAVLSGKSAKQTEFEDMNPDQLLATHGVLAPGIDRNDQIYSEPEVKVRKNDWEEDDDDKDEGGDGEEEAKEDNVY